MPPPDRSRRLPNLQQRSTMAGEAAAAAAEVEVALDHPADPTSAAFFDVDNTVMQGAHPVLERALAHATAKLLDRRQPLEIQSTTGPGNLTAALAAHARDLHANGNPPDFEILFDWELTAEPCWDLAYRNDARNWRYMDGQ